MKFFTLRPLTSWGRSLPLALALVGLGLTPSQALAQEGAELSLSGVRVSLGDVDSDYDHGTVMLTAKIPGGETPGRIFVVTVERRDEGVPQVVREGILEVGENSELTLDLAWDLDASECGKTSSYDLVLTSFDEEAFYQSTDEDSEETLKAISHGTQTQSLEIPAGYCQGLFEMEEGVDEGEFDNEYEPDDRR